MSIANTEKIDIKKKFIFLSSTKFVSENFRKKYIAKIEKITDGKSTPNSDILVNFKIK